MQSVSGLPSVSTSSHQVQVYLQQQQQQQEQHLISLRRRKGQSKTRLMGMFEKQLLLAHLKSEDYANYFSSSHCKTKREDPPKQSRAILIDRLDLQHLDSFDHVWQCSHECRERSCWRVLADTWLYAVCCLFVQNKKIIEGITTALIVTPRLQSIDRTLLQEAVATTYRTVRTRINNFGKTRPTEWSQQGLERTLNGRRDAVSLSDICIINNWLQFLYALCMPFLRSCAAEAERTHCAVAEDWLRSSYCWQE